MEVHKEVAFWIEVVACTIVGGFGIIGNLFSLPILARYKALDFMLVLLFSSIFVSFLKNSANLIIAQAHIWFI